MPTSSYSLFPHQADAEGLLTCGNGMLAWEMRCGKTRAVLHAWSQLLDAGEFMDLIVVSQKGVRAVWPEEAEEIGLQLPVRHYYGTRPSLADDDLSDAPELITLNWEITPQWRHALMVRQSNRPFALVLDETHLNCRNPRNQRYQAVATLARNAKHTWLLTGTVLVKNGLDLYWQLRLLGCDNPLRGMDVHRFAKQFCHKKWNPFARAGQGDWEYVGLKNADLLAERMTTVSSLYESDVRSLPLPTHLPRYLDEKKQLKRYLNDREIEKDLGAIASHKADLAAKYVLELKHRPVVVFGWHVELVQRLAAALEAPSISGSTSGPERDRLRRDFQAGNIPILVGNYRSMGLGIDLSAAHHAVYAEPWYDAALMAQAQARLYGPKQKHEVVHHYLLIAGSVDEHVWKAKLDKGRMIDQLRKASVEARHMQ